jgi:hypothetical protein
MANVADIYQALLVVDPVDHAVISDTHSPEILCSTQLSDATGAWLPSQDINRFNDSVLHELR